MAYTLFNVRKASGILDIKNASDDSIILQLRGDNQYLHNKDSLLNVPLKDLDGDFYVFSGLNVSQVKTLTKNKEYWISSSILHLYGSYQEFILVHNKKLQNDKYLKKFLDLIFKQKKQMFIFTNTKKKSKLHQLALEHNRTGEAKPNLKTGKINPDYVGVYAKNKEEIAYLLVNTAPNTWAKTVKKSGITPKIDH